jgi:AcrR family transcriptional regulator
MSNRSELLDAALAYLAEHGVANVSLRPMADALGTSARMLLFYFGSKDGLLRAVMEELHARLRASFLDEVHRNPGKSPRQPLKRFWEWATIGDNSAYLRLLYEMQVIAAQNPGEYRRHLEGLSADWQSLALSTLSQAVRSPAMATLCIAVFDGLFLEFMATTDRDRLTEALDLFIDIASKSA